MAARLKALKASPVNDWTWKVVKASLAVLLGFWLTIPAAVQLLVVLSAFDVLSCLLTHRSSMRDTLRRIAGQLLLCGAIHVVFVMAKDISGFNVGFDMGTAVALFYVFGELLEVTLNCSTACRIPPKLVEWLEAAQGMTGKQKEDLAHVEHDSFDVKSH
jgi:phage-related holin